MGPRFGRVLGFGVLILTLPGCASGPQDLVELTQRTSLRIAGEPLGRIEVRLGSDRRPPHEHGIRRPPGRSSLGGNSLFEPADVAFLRVLARDLQDAGVASEAGLQVREPDYVVVLHLEHLAASYNEGVETLVVPVLPTSVIHARCEAQITLRDPVGRRFFDRVFAADQNATGALIDGLESAAAEALADALRSWIDQAIPALYDSVGEFWKQYPKPVNPLRG